MQACDHDSYATYKRLIGPLRERAMELGYAIGVHGTLKRDIDLIACPWTNESVDAIMLAGELLKVCQRVNGVAFIKPGDGQPFHRQGCPGMKWHGRRVWSFHLGGGPYVDLSVMPRREAPLSPTLSTLAAFRWTYGGRFDPSGCSEPPYLLHGIDTSVFETACLPGTNGKPESERQ